MTDRIDPKATADELRARAETLRAMFPTDGTAWDDARLDAVAADTIDALVKQLSEADRQFTALKVSSGKSDARAVDLAAVVEKVRGEAEEWQAQSFSESAPVPGVGDLFLCIISTAPTDALAEHDARLIEGLADDLNQHFQDIPAWTDAYREGVRTNEWMAGATRMTMSAIGVIRERARQVREGEA